MKILLLGKNGQVGWELQRTLAPLGEVVAPSRADGADLARLDRLGALVAATRPDVIVNAAAYTAVDKAESEPELAFRINGEAPAELARTAAACGATLIHYSTDYVFDGSGNTPRDEAAPTGALSVYGRSKLAGEEAIRAAGCRHIIFRTSWVYGVRGQNFARNILRLAATRDELRVIDDQIGAPTGAALIADTTALAVHALPRHPGLEGTYHLVAGGAVSWFGYARFLLEEAAARGASLKATAESIKPIPTDGYPLPARRPANSRLDVSRLEQALALRMPPWQHGLARFLDEAKGLWEEHAK
ncbi:MAG: dTDP-4-dehydrorhamnose reductase [Betaproteobacteria bacterium]